MARIERFEEIESWKKARELTLEIYRLTREGPSRRDFRYIDQIRSARVSIMSNIAEGFERDGNAEFRQFLFIAKGSAGEVQSRFYIGLDAGNFSEEQFQLLFRTAIDITRLNGGLIRYLDQSDLQGRKYANRE